MRAAIVTLAVLLAGCAAEPMQPVSTASGLTVSCNGPWGWEACHREARAVCGGAYTVVARSDDNSASNAARQAFDILLADPSAPQAPGRGPNVARSMAVACGKAERKL